MSSGASLVLHDTERFLRRDLRISQRDVQLGSRVLNRMIPRDVRVIPRGASWQSVPNQTFQFFSRFHFVSCSSTRVGREFIEGGEGWSLE